MGVLFDQVLATLKAAGAAEQVATGYWQTITGAVGSDILDLGPGHNTAEADAGDDLVLSREGYNNVMLGAGNDTLGVFAGKIAYDAVDGGDGADTIYAVGDNASINLRALSNVEAISADGHANVSIRAGDWTTLDFTNVTLTGIAMIHGASAGETIIGSRGDDVIAGHDGYDMLAGGKGNDSFLIYAGETAYDRIDGGKGNDTISAIGDNTVIALSGLTSIETITAAGYGNVTIQASDWATIDLRKTVLDNIAQINGASAGETITGSARNDVIDGREGYDNLRGFDGDDTFLYTMNDGHFDRVDGGNGQDAIHAMADHAVIGLSRLKNVEVIDSSGFSDVSIRISEWAKLDLSKVEVSGIARIEGAGAGETIKGSQGDDTIIGGDGYDNLRGNGGNDTFVIRAGETGYDRIKGGEGKDAILAEGDGTVIGLSSLRDVERIDAQGFKDVVIRISEWGKINLSNVDVVGVSRIEGAGASETIKASKGNDVIDGGAGNDTLSGCGGSDTFVFGGGSGHDRIRDFGRDGGDAINLTIEGIDSFKALMDHASQSGKDVILDFGSDTLTLAGVKLGALNVDWFHFG